MASEDLTLVSADIEGPAGEPPGAVLILSIDDTQRDVRIQLTATQLGDLWTKVAACIGAVDAAWEQYTRDRMDGNTQWSESGE